MSTKRFFLALALMVATFGSTMKAADNWTSIFSSAAFSPEWTFDCVGGGSETFTNLGANASSYATRTWTGDNGVAWSATDARTDQTLTGKAVALRTSTLKNTSTVTGGVGTLSFNYQRVFTGNSTMKVFVNGIQYGGDITVSATTTTVYSQVINVAGNVTIEIRNSGGSSSRIIVDDIAWTCYEVPAVGPEMQLVDASNVNKDCGELAVNFGSHSVGVSNDAIFTIKNSGISNLVVSGMSLSNATDFTIISPASFPLTIAPSGSTIVLVRFNAASAGVKNSTLTITNNDASEGSCDVALSGIGLVPCVSPVITASDVDVDTIGVTTAHVAVSYTTADAYIAIVSTLNPLSAAPVDGSSYNVGDIVGGGKVVFNGSLTDFNVTGLVEDTDYFVYVFPYNNTNCTGGPLYYTTTSIESSFSTLVAPCTGATETFANIGTTTPTTYMTRTWTGDNGDVWSATDARIDQTLTGNAIALRTGTLKNTIPVSGGIGVLSFNYKRVFTGNSTLKVLVNGVQYGADITVSSDLTTAFSQAINVTGPITVELVNSGNRTVIDDVNWTCYQAPNRPELQLLDSSLVSQDCGFEINLGNVLADTDKEVTFTIKNIGTQALNISAISIDDAVNYTIVSPAAPFTVNALSTQDVVVSFNGATLGSKPAVLTIASNDEDEASCTVNFLANVAEPCVVPVVTTGDVTASNETFETVDIEVEGITADNYLVLISESGATTAPTAGVTYNIGDVIGNATVAYAGSEAIFSLEGLDQSTTYVVNVYAFNSNCVGGPLYSEAALETEFTTTAGPCVGSTETFTNMGTPSTAYGTKNWTGDNGTLWTATDSRNDLTLTGRAVTVRSGSIKNTSVITGGIGTLSFNYKREFTGNSTIKVFVNGTQYGADIAVTSTTPANFSQVINVSADATIEIVNSGTRSTIDDLTWDCYAGSGARQGLTKSKSLEVTSEITLYPNPNNGQFQIDLNSDSANVTIYDALGKLVFNKEVSDNEVINLDNAGKGIYMVVITSGSTVSSKKIVIN